MSHEIIIIDENGSGAGGTATAHVEWRPADNLTPEELAKREKKARKKIKQALEILYGHSASWQAWIP